MSQPQLAHFQAEGPVGACVIQGHYLGWAICTSLSYAMGADKATLGRVRMTGCQFRRETGDTVGGTTIEQNAAVAIRHGVSTEVRTGSRVASPTYVALQLQQGRGVSLGGNLSALMGTSEQSNGNAVNHNIYINHVRGGTLGHPNEAFVYDPAANGRVAGWGKAPQGPRWWPWGYVLAFAAALRPAGDDSHVTLGPGKMYAGIFPDTEPHAHVKVFHGMKSIKTTPFPDRCVIHSPSAGKRVNVRRGPGLSYGVITTLASGAPWVASQVIHGQKVNGSALWYGDHQGGRWIHASGLAGLGGSI